MFNGFDNRYQRPGINHFSNTVISQRYLLEKAQLTKTIAEISYLSVTSDRWSSLNRDPYMSLTAHYIDAPLLESTAEPFASKTICEAEMLVMVQNYQETY